MNGENLTGVKVGDGGTFVDLHHMCPKKLPGFILKQPV